MADSARARGRVVKRIALILLGLTGLFTAVVGSLATSSASHACTLAPTGSACYTPFAKVFGGVALLVCGLAVVAVVLVMGWTDHKAVVESKRWRHLETVRIPAGTDPLPERPKYPRP